MRSHDSPKIIIKKKENLLLVHYVEGNILRKFNRLNLRQDLRFSHRRLAPTSGTVKGKGFLKHANRGFGMADFGI